MDDLTHDDTPLYANFQKDILDVYDPNAQWEIYSVDGRNLKLGEKQLSDPLMQNSVEVSK